MNNNECNVARDLMPLVIDQVASEESRMLVEAHVAACEPCAQVYLDMQAKTPEQGDAVEDTSFAAAMRQLRRTVMWRRIKLIVISVTLTLLLLAAGIGINQLLFVDYLRDMPLDWYNMTLSRTKDGTGIITVTHSTGALGSLEGYANTLSGIMVWGSKCALIPTGLDEQKKVPVSIVHPGIRWKDGVGFVFAGDGTEGNTTDIAVKEIRMGTMENYRILYRQGGEVPLCSDKLETIFQLERKQADAQEEATNIGMDLAALYDSIGPEWK